MALLHALSAATIMIVLQSASENKGLSLYWQSRFLFLLYLTQWVTVKNHFRAYAPVIVLNCSPVFCLLHELTMCMDR